MSKTNLIVTTCLLLLMSCAVSGDEPGQAVEDTERAFADTMAKRDFEGFKTFISEEAIFFSGVKALRGRQQIADAWEVFFKDPLAPFSWEPEQVEVLDSGTLAWSTGPVYDADGKLVATFSSVWRLDASNKWRIIFDKGNDVCDCPKP
jgi:ketosteroid isomerase-like protein